jgi:SNF2 family DNA or RNA helicase
MPNKDDILKELLTRKEAKTKLENDWRETQEEVKTYEKAYEEIKKRFQEVEATFKQRRNELRSVEREDQQNSLAIESLQRQLSQIMDAERVHQDYLDQVTALQDATLSAPWRKENRSDGWGAYEYQIDGAIHLAVAKRGLLGDVRGLGKSLTSLIWADINESKRTLIISPRDTQDNYIREIKRWTPHRSPIKIGQMPQGQRQYVLAAMKNAPVYTMIMNFEAWRRDNTLIPDLLALEFDTIIIDEAHHAKEMKTHTAQGIRELCLTPNTCPGCDTPDVTVKQYEPWMAECECGYYGDITDFNTIKNFLPMSGSFILNKPQELFPHVHIMMPKLFPSEKMFLRDYCEQLPNRHWVWRQGGEERLMKKMSSRYIARDRKSAGVIVPPNAEVEHIITMEEMQEKYPKQFRAYEQIRENGMLVLDPDSQTVMNMPNFLALITRLRQGLVWPNGIELVEKDEEGEVIHREKLNVFESIKLDFAENLIKEIVSEGERVILFSQFKPGLKILQERLGDKSVVYDGSASGALRNQIQLDFDVTTMPKNPRWDIALINYKSGGEGLNFTGATHEIQLDSMWNPGGEDQAIGRIDRIGQTKDTETHFIRVQPSIDIWMKDLIEEKRDMIGGFRDIADLYQQTYDKLRKGEI